MPEQLLIDQCSPTLAGLKTGNMFPVSIEPGEDLCGELRRLNRLLKGKGIRVVILRRTDTTALLYLYRPDYRRGILDIPRHGGSWRRKDIAAAVRENALPS